MKNSSFGIIYKVINEYNSKIYIGQTIVGLSKRKEGHINDSLANRDNNYFHNAIRKYGKESFTWEIIEYCESKEELDDMEFHYIKQYNSFDNGYNLTLGGGGMLGYRITKAHRDNLSKSHIGYEHTKEQRAKISKALTGRPCSIETRKKISEGNKKAYKKSPDLRRFGERNGFYGKSLSKEVIANLIDINSAIWEIIYPSGKKEIIKNLSKFCRKYDLSKGTLCSVSNGHRKHHKGFKCKKITKSYKE